MRRDIPAYPYRAEPATCDQVSSGNFTLPQELTCRTPPVVADRFCAARRAGDDCTIEGVVGDAQPETVMYAGRCEQLTQQYPYVNDGLRTAKREILQCKPLTVGPPPKPAQ
ncbi:MAG: hypothetical protein IPK34_17290 [Ramlibacter sp.]|nr:hypothetical protein [Ramlibacter sp.]